MTHIDENNRGKLSSSAKSPHIPVLQAEVLNQLTPKKGESYLDVTAGYGEHATAILERTLQPERALFIDRDQNAISHLKAKYQGTGIKILPSSFLEASQSLVREKAVFDMILADLGMSSPHIDVAERGFSISGNGPLDMRMDQTQALTAKEIVNNYSEAQLVDLLRRYGEEPKAHQIARSIISHRPLTTTDQLATIAARAWPGHSKHHPATRTFQAIRIAVNDELRQLSESLPLWVDLLAPGGRLAVISFHSLEDRLVKQFLAEHSTGYEAQLSLLTKKPVTASNNELVSNPRARSAKLRAAVKK